MIAYAELNGGRRIIFKDVVVRMHDCDKDGKRGDIETTVLKWEAAKNGVVYERGCAPNYRPVEITCRQIIKRHCDMRDDSIRVF